LQQLYAGIAVPFIHISYIDAVM